MSTPTQGNKLIVLKKNIWLSHCKPAQEKKSKQNLLVTGQLDYKDKLKFLKMYALKGIGQTVYTNIQPNHFSPIPGTSDATHYWEG